MRPGDAFQAVGDSLQADVMRFMAIIAFCLIAILALVRSVEPQPRPEQDAVPGDEPAAVADLQPARAPEAPPEPQPLPAATPRLAVAPAAERPAPPRRSTPAPEPVPEVVRTEAPVPAAKREGLSLRFASDQDFLRLVNRGAIRVFAFNEQSVLSLEQDFSFQPAAAPGRVHELLPETIPALMTGALARSHGNRGYRWGIEMPARMARQIRAFVDDGATGELVIDRFGEVRHHDA